MTDAPFKFAANVRWLYPGTSLGEALHAAATEGFRGVEIPNPYSEPAEEVRRLLVDAGLEAVLLNTPLGAPGSPTANGAACVPEAVTEFREGVERGLEYAVALGCPTLHVVGGRRPEGVSRERAFAQYVHNIGWAAEQARSAKVGLVLEMQNQRSVPGFVLDSQATTAAVVETVGEPVGLLFDVFHTQMAEGDVVGTFDAVSSLITHVQLGDAPLRSEPGTGELSWPFVLGHIQRSGYTGWLGCEFQPDGSATGLLTRLVEVAR